MPGTFRTVVLAAAAATLFSPATARARTAAGEDALRVLVSADEPPEVFSFAEAGPPGIEREILQGFCRATGRTLEIVQVPSFDRTIPLLLEGAGDIVTGIVDTETRREKIAFTSEVLPVRHLIVSRVPRHPVARVVDLRGLRIAVLAGTTWATAAVEAGVVPSRLRTLDDMPQLLQALTDGSTDAVVMSLLDYALARKRDPALEAGTFLGPLASQAFGVRKTDEALRTSLDAYLAATRTAKWRLVSRYLSDSTLSLFLSARNPSGAAPR